MLRTNEAEALLARIRDLPVLPQALADLMKAMQREDVAIDQLAATISHDQALTAKTLRLANSSFYGMPRRITSIRDAIGVLGLRNLGMALTAAGVSGCFALPQCRGFDLVAHWRHAVACALCARHAARVIGLDDTAAFTAGLLHDIGRLALASGLPETLAPVYEHRRLLDCQMDEAERALLGTDHADIGATIAMRWHFGSDVVEAIRHHHAPPGSTSATLTDVVHAANAIVHALDLSGVPDDMVPALAPDAWNRLGLDAGACHRLFAQTEAELNDLCEALSV